MNIMNIMFLWGGGGGGGGDGLNCPAVNSTCTCEVWGGGGG